MSPLARGPLPVRVIQLAAFAGLCAYAAQSGVTAFGAGVDQFFETWVYDGLILAAATLCFTRAACVSAERWAWSVLGFGLVAWAAGDFYYSLALFHLDNPPLPSVSDALWLSFYPACYVAIVLLVRERVPGFSTSLWLDGLIGSLAAGALATAFLFGSVIHGNEAAVRVDLTYEVGDLLLMAFVAAVFAHTGWRSDRALAMVGAGVLGSAVADGFFLYHSATDSALTSTLIATLWPASALLIGCAAWQQPSAKRQLRLNGWRVFLVPSGFAASGLVLIAYSTFKPLNHVTLVLAFATLAAVIVRMALTFRENMRLLAKSRAEALTDALTGLGNRRKLVLDLDATAQNAALTEPCALLLFDLDGFKAYNDLYGHPLGDVLLTHLGRELQAAVEPNGNAYRLGGDEFCVMATGNEQELDRIASAAKEALCKRGEGFLVRSSLGKALIPHDSTDPSLALHMADERLYAQKHNSRRSSVSPETTAALLDTLREPSLRRRLDQVALLSCAVGERLGFSIEALSELARAARLYDVGKAAVPDAVLQKAGPLDASEWEFLRQHTIVGERMLNSVPALTSVARLVRSSHERYDGHGYPDGKAGKEIPLGSRIIAACDAFHAMTSNRPYGRSMTKEEALEELARCANQQFDPKVVVALHEAITWDDCLQPRQQIRRFPSPAAVPARGDA